MAGSHGQRVYVSPSQDLIVVRLGRRAGFRDRIFLERCFDNSWLALRATKKTARGANRVLFLTRTTQQAFIPRSPRVGLGVACFTARSKFDSPARHLYPVPNGSVMARPGVTKAASRSL